MALDKALYNASDKVLILLACFSNILYQLSTEGNFFMTVPFNHFRELTELFNHQRIRVIISSGQAVVFLGLTMMSKDGDWIIREDQEAFDFVLKVLSGLGANYRFGAPLALPWHAGGWSSHLEFKKEGLRIRTDFVSRPPRVSPARLLNLWKRVEQEASDVPVVYSDILADIKKTNREKDYPIIGEIARTLTDRKEVLLYSRSARDILKLFEEHKDLVEACMILRPALAAAKVGLTELERALDEERRTLMKLNEVRLQAYAQAGRAYLKAWPLIASRIANMPLIQAHTALLAQAEQLLPEAVKL